MSHSCTDQVKPISDDAVIKNGNRAETPYRKDNIEALDCIYCQAWQENVQCQPLQRSLESVKRNYTPNWFVFLDDLMSGVIES